MNPSMESTIPRNREEKELKLMLRTDGSSKTVGRSNPIVQPINLHDELDLRTNPFKGGGDGVILDGPNMISSPSREEEEQHSPLRRKEEGLDVCFSKLELSKEEAHGWTQRGGAATAHELATAQEGEATRLWQGLVSRVREKAQQEAKQPQAQIIEEKEKRWLQVSKPKKRPFHIWCWTCTRKKPSTDVGRGPIHREEEKRPMARPKTF